jgi:hypothetical protein
MRPALTHVSTMGSYNPACDAMGFTGVFPSFLVTTSLFLFVWFFLFPSDLYNGFPSFSALVRAIMGRVTTMESMMAIDAVSADRAAAADRREAARQSAQQYLAERADARRDTRVEEAKAAEAMRPTVAERAAAAPPSVADRAASAAPSLVDRLLDIKV